MKLLRLPRPSPLWTISVLFVAGLLGGCDRTTASSGGSGDETSTVAFYRPDGKPAVNARVRLYGSGDTGVYPRKEVVTDANGHANIPAPEKGFYNLVVRDTSGKALFQDSLFSDGEAIHATSDTVRPTGVVTGRLKVQPQHSPRIAWVQVLGAGIWVNVDDSGRFRIDRVPAGRFTLAALTRNTDYTPTFATARVKADSTTDVGTIELVYTGLPVVKNLQARFDTLAGLVYLQWDSIALRTSWRYKVYRDEILLGQTIGSRWIDTVSDELPANVVAQGKHTYRVVLADAQRDGPQWESITMQVISPFLYQEIKFDWRKMSSLPWSKGLYRIDTAGSDLVCWKSLEYGSRVPSSNASGLASDMSTGLIQMWASSDSGKTWVKRVDSLPLGALPVRYGSKWWSVRADGRSSTTNPSDSFWLSTVAQWMPDVKWIAGMRFEAGTVMSSVDGRAWDSVSRVVPTVPLTSWRFDLSPRGLHLIGGCSVAACQADQSNRSAYSDRFWWTWTGDSFATSDRFSTGTYLTTNFDVSYGKTYWSDGVKLDVGSGQSTQKLNGTYLSASVVHSKGNDWSTYGLMTHFGFKQGPSTLLFGVGWALSMDSAMTVFHDVSWPGYGAHYEIRYAGGILSASDSGVYLGRILPDSGLDPRGTWVKQTLVPSVY